MAKFDENLARQYAGQSAGAEAQLTVIFARALAQMQPPLSHDQLSQLKTFQSGRFSGIRDEAGNGRRAGSPPEIAAAAAA